MTIRYRNPYPWPLSHYTPHYSEHACFQMISESEHDCLLPSHQIDGPEHEHDLYSDASQHTPKAGTVWYIAYYIPLVNLIRTYKLAALPGDICAGISLASFQIPISLSYATSLAHVDPICGLYGLILPPLVYACFGTVPTMVVAPEGPISLILGKLSLNYIHDGNASISLQQLSALVSGIAGAVILAFGILRVGFLTHILAQSLLRGFITGVGVVIFADQLPVMLGISQQMHDVLGSDNSSYAKLKYTLSHWTDAHSTTSWFAFTALAVLILLKHLKTYLVKKHGFKRAVLIPDILIVVIVSTVVCYLGNYDERGLDVVGKVRSGSTKGMWMLQPKFFSEFKRNFHSSFYIAILGLLESTVAARLLAPQNVIRSANRELVALGASNLVGSLLGALPSFGGYGKSRMNMLCGGTTQVSGAVAALVTLLCTFKLMNLVFHLPRCTLSAIIAQIGLNLIAEAPAEVGFFWEVKAYSDLATMGLSFLTTFFWSVEAGVTVGIGVALLRVIHHATRPRIQILTRELKPGAPFQNADDVSETSIDNRLYNSSVLVIKIPEPLTFANSAVLETRLRRIELHGSTRVHPGLPPSRDHPLRTVVFYLNGMTECDASAAATLKSIVEIYLNRGIRVVFACVVPNKHVREILDLSGIKKMLYSQPQVPIFNSLEDALDSVNHVSEGPA